MISKTDLPVVSRFINHFEAHRTNENAVQITSTFMKLFEFIKIRLEHLVSL